MRVGWLETLTSLPEVVIATKSTGAEDNLATTDVGVDLGLRNLDDRVHVRLEALFDFVPVNQ